MRSQSKSKVVQVIIYLLGMSLLVTACNPFKPSPEEEALTYAISACGLQKNSEGSDGGGGSDGEEGNGKYVQPTQSSQLWYADKISMAELREKKKIFADRAKDATHAKLLDSNWQNLETYLNELSGFVDNVYILRQSNGYLGNLNPNDFNSPLRQWLNTCAVVTDLANE